MHQLTLITSEKPTTLGKTYTLLADGKIEKATAGEMMAGFFEVIAVKSATDLATFLQRVRTDQAITASTPRNAATSGRIVTRKAKALATDKTGLLARTKEDFAFPPGPGVMVLDYDPPQSGAAMSQTDLWETLTSVCPAAADSAAAWWCSSSSYIYHGTEQIAGLKGQRIYLLVQNAADIPRAGKALSDRLWLAGHGRIEISAAGSLLQRDVFDLAMHQPARLDFIGGAVCTSPLRQDRPHPLVLADGPALDTAAALPDLNHADLAKLDGLKAIAREKAAPAAALRRAEWIAERRAAQSLKLVEAGLPLHEATERAERVLKSAVEGGQLLGDFEVILAGDRRPVKIAEILDHPDRYHGAETLDPLEPEYRNYAQTGKLMLYQSTPVLFSQAHGGRRFILRRQPASICISGNKAEVASTLAQKLAAEPDIFSYAGQPAVVEGTTIKLLNNTHAITFTCCSRFALTRQTPKGETVPAPSLDGEIAGMVLHLIGGR